MYTLSDVSQVIHSPKSALREANRLYHTRGRRWNYNRDGVNVFDEDWDNLILLDACRYDFFEKLSTDLPGRLESRTSRGAATYEWVRGTFENRTLHDTVYVTANSWYQRLKDELDAEVFKLIDLHMGDEDGQYHSDEFKVVMPDVMTKHARRAAEEYPNKRLLIHYIQPHHPFIGPTGRRHFTRMSSVLNEVIDASEEATPRLVRQAYHENLEIVLSEVEDLFQSLEGKTVVSADHGEMLGDRHDVVPVADYGHHEGIYTDPLVKVPWHVYENGPRKRIVAEEPEDVADVGVDQLERRLEDLGYKI